MEGPAEVAIAGLMIHGISDRDAQSIVEHACAARFGCEDGKLPAGEIKVVFRVCKDCIARSGFEHQ